MLKEQVKLNTWNEQIYQIRMCLSSLRTKLSFRSNFQPHLAQPAAKPLITSTECLSLLNLFAHHFTFALHYILMCDVLKCILSLALCNQGKKQNFQTHKHLVYRSFQGTLCIRFTTVEVSDQIEIRNLRVWSDPFQLQVLLGHNSRVLYPTMCLYVFKLGIVLN